MSRLGANPDQTPPQGLGPYSLRLWDLSVRIARLEEKLDAVISGTRRVDDHEVRIKALELSLAGSTARRGLGTYVFNTLLAIALALVGLGVWYR